MGRPGQPPARRTHVTGERAANRAPRRKRDHVLWCWGSFGCDPPIVVGRRESRAVASRDDRYFADLGSAAWDGRQRAAAELFAQGSGAVPTLVAGAAHSRPQVRAACIALMDHLADERCCEPLLAGLRDASSLVRRHAVHAVGCQRCKATPLPIDIEAALVERALHDSSPRVRRVAVHQLGLQPHDPRAIKALVRLVAESRDVGLVSRARHALREQRARAD